ncbi:Receptor-like serine/threonine-protein kinase [Forsythia ovata]|uniref:Receptor-like serine/threonine-protein kinase n=1 Tax=Forsythia ovata TaxID=205694 RepID=A0ABD1TAM9_9LAMI
MDELGQALGLLGLEKGLSELESMIQSFIEPGNTGLRFEDFEALHRSLNDVVFGLDVGNPDEESDLTEVFKVFDEDGDGYISAKELQVVLGKLGLQEGMEIDRVEKMISSVDRNHDGRVDFFEFKDMMRSVMNASGSAVWTSFDHPIDVIVPTQNFTLRHTLSSELYSFKLQENGNLTLWWNDNVEYYNFGLNSTRNSSFTNPILDIRSTWILTLSNPTLPNPLDLAYSSDYAEEGNILRFLKFDNDGNLRIYSSAISSRTQIEKWAAVDDQCQVYGFCGNMGICSYNDSNPVCRCPSDNFELIYKRESRKGCKRKVELRDCPGRETMLPLEHSIFLTYPPELFHRKFTYPPELSSYRRKVVSESTMINSDGMHGGEMLNKDSR